MKNKKSRLVKTEISEDGVLSVSTKDFLKNPGIRRQYELLKDPEFRAFLLNLK